MPIVSPFTEHYGYKFRGQGASGTVTAGTTGDIDYKLTENRKINAVHLMVKDGAWGDTVKFQVVDRDGVYYPAGTLLDEFATDWNIDPSIIAQRQEKTEYPASLLTGMVVRVKYTSTGGTDVKVRVNLYLHKTP